MLAGTTAKRLSGLVLPLVIGGSVLAVRAASASDLQAGAASVVCAPASSSTTTTAGGTTTTAGGGLPIPTTLPGILTTTGATTTTLATTTTACTTSTTGGTTTTVNCTGLTIPISSCPSTTTSSTTTTVKPTTTTVPQTPVRITSIASDHVAGHSATISGSAGANKLVILNGTDRKNGRHELGETTSSSNGSWHVRLAHGVLYNTALQAASGTQRSNTAHLNVHQVLKITSVKLVSEGANGFTYKLTGKSASHVPGEAITVIVNGKTVGKGKMRANGTFTVKFLVKNRSQALRLHGTGRSGSGVEYTLVGNKKFHVH